jgi:hypothetical protein
MDEPMRPTPIQPIFCVLFAITPSLFAAPC